MNSNSQNPLNANIVKEYVGGIDSCVANAIRLLHDAKILERSGSIPSAIGLATFAWEEIGKAVLLLQDLLEGKALAAADWKGRGKFMDHKLKLLAPSRHRTLIGQPRNPHSPEAEEAMTRLFHEGRLRSFFVDWSEESRWFSPTNQEYVGDLTLLLGSVLPGAEGWLGVVEPFWCQRRQLYINQGKSIRPAKGSSF